MSTWAFGCTFGLRQDDCGEYEPDPEARGYGRWDGCPSCVWRQPANAATVDAETAWAMRHDLRDILRGPDTPDGEDARETSAQNSV